MSSCRMWSKTCTTLPTYNGWNTYAATYNVKPNNDFYVCTHLPASNGVLNVVA